MYVTLLGIVIAVRLEQRSKAEDSIDVTFFPIFMFVSWLQSIKVEPLIVVRPLPIVTLVRPVQYSNA